MGDDIENIRLQTTEKICMMTAGALSKLTDIWRNAFEDDQCKSNLLKMISHVEQFYNEVLEESKTREQSLMAEITDLLQEAANLKRLLNVDIHLEQQENMPLYTYKLLLNESLQNLRVQLEDRRNVIRQLLIDQNNLCNDLDEPTHTLTDDPLATAEDIRSFQIYLNELRNERSHRLNEMTELKIKIKLVSSELEISLIEEPQASLMNDDQMKPTKLNLNRLKHLLEKLIKQRCDIIQKIEDIKEKLIGLWDCLDVSTPHRNIFLGISDCKQSSYERIRNELSRCQDQKRQNIKRFIDHIRNEIVNYWNMTLKSDKERARFTNFTDDCYTEDLLSLHEFELDELKKFYNDNKPIFEKYNERKSLWDRMLALEAKENEPGRYNNRGGQLLREERERKMITTKLPKIEEQIIALVEAYEQRSNRTFLIWGEDIREIIQRDYERHRENKVLLNSARKAGKDAVTPAGTHRSMIKTPISVKGHTSSIKRMASTTNIMNTGSTKKSKLEVKSEMGQVKRSLLSELNSNTPGIFIKPKSTNKTPFKSPMKRIIATLTEPTRRRSNRLSRNKKQKKLAKNMPKIIVSSEGAPSESILSYDSFEGHISSRSPCRSSIIQKDRTIEKKNRTVRHKLTPCRLPLPTTMNTICTSEQRSPRKLVSPASGRKLTTKNLPIII